MKAKKNPSQFTVTPAAQPLKRIYNEKLWVHKEVHATISSNSLYYFYSINFFFYENELRNSIFPSMTNSYPFHSNL